MVPLLRVMHGAIRVRRRTLVQDARGLAAAAGRVRTPSSRCFPTSTACCSDARARGASPACPSSWCSPTSPISRRASGSSPASTASWSGLPKPPSRPRTRRTAGERVSRVSGMILHPRFYATADPSVRAARARGARARARRFHGDAALRRQGLARDRAARRAAAGRDRAPSRDRRVRRQPAALRPPGAARRRGAAAGFNASASPTASPSFWPRATCSSPSPGPGSLSEAFHRRVPVVVTRNMHTIPQERFNTEFVANAAASASWCRAGARSRPRSRVLRREPAAASTRCAPASRPCLPNRAVYEVLEIIGVRRRDITPLTVERW